jgi:hypothetical protein
MTKPDIEKFLAILIKLLPRKIVDVDVVGCGMIPIKFFECNYKVLNTYTIIFTYSYWIVNGDDDILYRDQIWMHHSFMESFESYDEIYFFMTKYTNTHLMEKYGKYYPLKQFGGYAVTFIGKCLSV